jgi:uncharacterized protein YndB with AHSA1/START domain
MTAIDGLGHQLERTLLIRARPEIVFRFFTDSVRWAAWWGAGSTIDARPGGQVVIRYPNGVEARGEVLDVVAPERIVFSYGYASGAPIPAGGSRVTIHLEAHGSSTRLHLTHEFTNASVRDEHVQGWRFQLSLFGNLVATEVYAHAGQSVDEWFAAWSEPDATAREATLVRVAAPDVGFRDRFSIVDGIGEVVVHVGAAQRFMPGIQLRRQGEVRQCQGVVLADWIAEASDGQRRASGINVFVFDADGRIDQVTGFWDQHPNS